MARDDSERDPLEALSEEFLERHRRGEKPSVEEYAEQHPDLAATIRELFPTLLLMEDIGDDDEASSTAAAADAASRVDTDALTRIGDYRIVREVGRGGMGVVYEAEQVSLGRRVALKVLPFHSHLKPSALARFRQEARAAARLEHPHLVPVYEVGEHDGIAFYAMQFIQGQGLDAILEELRRLQPARSAGVKGGSTAGEDAENPARRAASRSMALRLASGEFRLDETEDAPRSADPPASRRDGASTTTARWPVSQTAETGDGSSGSHLFESFNAKSRYFRTVAVLGAQVAEALAAAHLQGVLHRDIKPSNLLLDFRGKIWVTDFGLAKAKDAENVTNTGDIVGTLRYMAPERFKGGSDSQSDVYGLGVTLYELATLQPAFQALDREHLVHQVLREDPVTPRRIDRDIPRDLETILLKAIDKDRTRRYASMDALATDLRCFIADRPIEARRTSLAQHARLWCRRNPVVASLSASIVVLLVVIAVGASIAALRLSEREREARESLWLARFTQAQASRVSGRVGQRSESLWALAAAAHAGIEPRRIRQEVIAALCLHDLQPRKGWPIGRAEVLDACPSAGLVALGEETGAITVRAVEDGRVLASLPASASAPRIVRLLADGERLVVGDTEGARLLEFRTGRLLYERDFDARRDGLAVSTSGTWLAVADGKELCIDDMVGESPRRRFPLPVTRPRMRFSPDDDRLLVWSTRSNEALVVELDHGEIETRLHHGGEVFSGSFHPSGDLIACASANRLVYLWRLDEHRRGRLVRTLEGHEAEASGAHFDSGGKLLFSTAWDGRICVWDHQSGRRVLWTEGVFCWVDGPEDPVVVSTGASIQPYRIVQSPEYDTVYCHPVGKGPWSAAFSPDSSLMATASWDGVLIWDARHRRPIEHLRRDEPSGWKWSVAFRDEPPELLASGRAGLFAWPVRSGPGDAVRVGPPRRVSEAQDLQELGLARSKPLAVTIRSQRPLLIDLETGETRALASHPRLSSVDIHPDGEWIVGGNWGGDGVPIWRVGQEEAVTVLPGKSAIGEFTPDGEWLLIAVGDHFEAWRVGEWTAPVHQRERIAQGEKHGYFAFAPELRLTALAKSRTLVELVEYPLGDPIAQLETPGYDQITSLEFSPDRTTLVATTESQLVKVWSLSALRARLKDLGLDWQPPGPPPSRSRPLRVRLLDADDERDIDANDRERP